MNTLIYKPQNNKVTMDPIQGAFYEPRHYKALTVNNNLPHTALSLLQLDTNANNEKKVSLLIDDATFLQLLSEIDTDIVCCYDPSLSLQVVNCNEDKPYQLQQCNPQVKQLDVHGGLATNVVDQPTV